MLTWVEISAAAIAHNIKQFRKLTGPNVLLMPVIKSNAYGHGFLEVAKIIDAIPGVARLSVASLDEALALCRQGIKKPIMVLAIYEFDVLKIKEGIRRRVIFPLYSLSQARLLNQLGKQIGKKAVVHLKIDVGASRVGIRASEALKFMAAVKRHPFLTCEGIYSHFSSSEENQQVTQRQLEIFNGVIKDLKQAGHTFAIQHLACSAAAALAPGAHFNAIRFGIGLYGLYPAKKIERHLKLKPALSWQTKIIQLKDISAGTKISYGGVYTANKPAKLAVLPIGYWDGYDRSFSNRAEVLIRGARCPIRGRVCMNLTMVDVSLVPQVKVGDRAVLIGRSEKEQITADELARIAGTINYEIITRINPLLPRLIN